MAWRCYFLSLTFWVCFVVLRLTYATNDEKQPHTWDGQLLFSPKSTKAFLLHVWRRNPHLAPLNKKLRPHIPSSYWLLLIAGDVESNPGPTKYPCTSCCKPVKSNQKGILCDRCDMWTHARCCYVDDDEYQRISALEDSCKWFCPTCTLSELPYADCSISSAGSLSTNLEILDTSTLDTSLNPSFSPKDLVFCHLNVQSLLSIKHDEISDFLSHSASPTILGLSETWLDSSIPDVSVSVDNYQLFRRDRPKGRGGGVLVLVPSSIRCRRRPDLENDCIEAIWLEIHVQRSTILLCNIYRHPRADGSFLDALSVMMELASKELKELLIMGDFNCNILSPSLTTRNLITIMQDYQLTQIISTPTCVSIHSQTIIDLCFTSSPQSFSSSGTIPLTASDHLMIYITRQNKIHNHIPKIQKVRSFKNCDPTFLSEDLCSAPWEVIETLTH